MHRNLIFDIDTYNEIPKFLRDSVIRPEQIVRTMNPMSQTAVVTNFDESAEKADNSQAGNAQKAQGSSGQTGEMTIEQLRAQYEELERKINEKQKSERKGVLDQIVKVMRDYSVPIEDVIEALGSKVKRQGVKAKAKYKDPNSDATWSGRGKAPKWIVDATDRTPFEIQ
jgi:DNA-binding protein H-NS